MKISLKQGSQVLTLEVDKYDFQSLVGLLMNQLKFNPDMAILVNDEFNFAPQAGQEVNSSPQQQFGDLYFIGTMQPTDGKINAIKLVRELSTYTLMESKNIVERGSIRLVRYITREEAESYVRKFKSYGYTAWFTPCD